MSMEDGSITASLAQVLHELRRRPGRVLTEVRRFLAYPYIRLLFRLYGVPWNEGWKIFGMPAIQRYGGSTISLGRNLILRSWPASNPLTPNHRVVFATRGPGAVIQIGDDCSLTGAVIVAAERVEIGDRVAIGANATITDTDFHPLDPEERLRDFNAGEHHPVRIEDDAFIGMNAIILKGVTIGRGSVVGAGSVVSRDVPSRVIVAGNPARVVRPLD